MNFLFVATSMGVLLGSLVQTNGSKLEPLSRDKRIVNGRMSSIREFPYLVALELYSRQICGGSIISPYHIVTAAHCLRHNNNSRAYQVRAGSSLREQGGTIHLVRSFNIHPEFQLDLKSTGLVKADVAVIRLVNEIRLDNKTRRSISMFEFGEKSEHASLATTPGWGHLWYDGMSSRLLQSVQLNIVDRWLCNLVWSLLTAGIQKGQICATNIYETQSICNGDSGGPLIINGKLAGIAAGAILCGSWPYPNVFTEISYFRKWIDENTRTRIVVDPVWDKVLMWDLYV